MTRICETRPLHLVTYENGMKMQELLVARRQLEEIPDQLLLLEHPPVITLGRAGDRSNLLAAPGVLRAQGIRFYETTRGGDITYHGPGQIVGYPIIHLGEGCRDIRKYVWRLEEVLIRTAAEFGVEASRVEGRRGIWVGDDKLAAIGVRIARWVTSHGFAFNVDPNLQHFGTITPCGLPGTGVTSLRKLTRQDIPKSEVHAAMVRHFGEVYERAMETKQHDLRVAQVVIHCGDRVLLVHRTEKAGGFWQPVTGSIHRGESPRDAAEREVQEETGHLLRVEDLGLQQSFLIEPKWLGEREGEPKFVEEHAFAAELDRSAPIALDEEEHDAWGWFTFEEAYERIQWSDDRDALELLEKRTGKQMTVDR